MDKFKTKFSVEKLRENPWMLSTIVLGVVTLLLLISSVSGKITGAHAGDLVSDFVKAQTGSEAEIVSVDEFSGLYQVNILFQGKEIPLYLTQDGENLVQGVTPLSTLLPKKQPTDTTEVPKSDKPKVGLYIWSYCPYGTAALGPFAKVAKLLKNVADFRVYLYYSGHGDHEIQQNKIQACIQNLGYDYWDYAEAYVSDIYPKCSRDIDCDLTESTALMDKLAINSAEVLSCVEKDGDKLLEDDYNSAKALGVTGSPTFVINDVKVSASRNAEAYKSAICDAFNTSPDTCNTKLDSDEATASGSCN